VQVLDLDLILTKAGSSIFASAVYAGIAEDRSKQADIDLKQMILAEVSDLVLDPQLSLQR